jgi:hypothetical protein
VVAQSGIQLAVGPPDKSLVLLEKAAQPRMVVRREEVRDHTRPRHAIAGQTIA